MSRQSSGFSTHMPGTRTSAFRYRSASTKIRATAEPQVVVPKDSSRPSQKPPLPDFEDFAAAAAEKGVNLELRTLGPVFWIEAKVGVDGLAGPPGTLIGTVNGFILPWVGGNILHLDTMRMARIESEKVRSIFGFALILGGAMLRHGYDRGCKKAELLAINDTDEYHRKLVAYYGRLGFKAVHEVTGGLRDVPHMLVWGGLGTRMDADIEAILRKWSKRFVRDASDGT